MGSLYFFITRSDMERLGIKEGDDEYRIAKAISGQDDCLYAEDLTPNFYNSDDIGKNMDGAPLIDLNSDGVIVEWAVEAGYSLEVWHGTFNQHPAFNQQSDREKIMSDIKNFAEKATGSEDLRSAVKLVSKQMGSKSNSVLKD